MNKSKDIEALNQLSLVSYLSILGYTPLARHPHATVYRVYFDGEPHSTIITVDHQSNRFHDPIQNIEGTLVDFACSLFGRTSIEILSNVMLYRIDLLMRQHSSSQMAALP